MRYHVGQRLSIKLNQLCTVRYVGPVEGKSGEWLGVEWDDPKRGKHNGVHDGKVYFECRSPSPTAGSFLKPKQTLDSTRTFLQALREKYMSEDDVNATDVIYFSGKQAEEVGFEKFARRQAQLQGIHVIVLDGLRITADEIENDRQVITQTCAHITELDLSRNLFETLDEVISICILLPRLRRLVLDGNRFNMSGFDRQSVKQKLSGIQTLGLSDTFLTWPELCCIASVFPHMADVAFANNAITHIPSERLDVELNSLDLAGNSISTFSDLSGLSHCPTLKTLVLKRNNIDQVGTIPSKDGPDVNPGWGFQDVDLAYNRISTWSILNAIPGIFPDVKHLRLTGNPLYKELRSVEGKLLSSEDGHILTIARLPQLATLNYSKITEKERLNADAYYLGQIALELSLTGVENENSILSQHPQWKALVKEYGKPNISRKAARDTIDPNSLAARLVTIEFTLSPTILPAVALRTWKEQIPKSLNVYALLGIVGKRLGVMPLRLRLIWETGERDPVGLAQGYSGPEWWDSDEETEGVGTKSNMMLREVELMAGTRAIGTYIEKRLAKVRVELRNSQ